MIMDMEKNKQKLSNTLNYHTANLGAGYGLGGSSHMSGTTPGDGMSQAQYQKMLMSQYQELQDANSVGDDKVLSQGKVTFKNKAGADALSPDSQPGGSTASLPQSRDQARPPKGKKGPKSKVDDEDMNKAGRLLKTEKISEICEERFLTRMEVYNIRSQFAGLCLMSKEDE